MTGKTTCGTMPEGHPDLSFNVAALMDNFDADHVSGSDEAIDAVKELLERIGTADARTLATATSEVLRVSLWAFSEQRKASRGRSATQFGATPENMFITQLAAMCPADVWEWMGELSTAIETRDYLDTLKTSVTTTMPEWDSGPFPSHNRNGHN